MKDRIIYRVSEQPASQTYRMPQSEVDALFGTYVKQEFEQVSTHMQRIHRATSMVLAHRGARLDQSLELDIPHETPMFEKLMQLVMGQPAVKENPRSATLRQLIEKESQLGAQIFGAFPAYDKRYFYCFDERMWIWYEERMNAATGKHDVMTVSYNITDRGILKSYGENQSSYVQDEELEHFTTATEEYAAKVVSELYSQN